MIFFDNYNESDDETLDSFEIKWLVVLSVISVVVYLILFLFAVYNSVTFLIF